MDKHVTPTRPDGRVEADPGRIRYRVGVMPGPWPRGPAGAEFLWTLVDWLERSDVDSLWLSDRVSAPLPVPEVMTTLAAVAARTTRLKLGPSVLVLPFRTPVVAAREMATVDWLSRGRLFPAVGIGVDAPKEFDASGIPFRERARRTDEAIEIIRLLWTLDEVSYRGQFFTLDRVVLLPKPWQRPPPIWIGGKSEAAIRRTARLGDGWMPSFVTPAEFRQGWAEVQAQAAAHGREVPPDHAGALVNYAIAPSRAEARALAEPFIPAGRVDAPTLEQCTAFGPAEVLAAKLEEFVAGGGSKFVVRPLCPPDRMLEQLQLAAEGVIPAFHRR
jgi:probable F420-dependent oxidoreductase